MFAQIQEKRSQWKAVRHLMISILYTYFLSAKGLHCIGLRGIGLPSEFFPTVSSFPPALAPDLGP